MDPEVVSEQEKAAVESGARQVATTVFDKFTNLGDPFRYSPDLSSSGWHVTGINETHNIVAALPVGQKGEMTVILNVDLSPDDHSLNLHLLDVTPEELESYRKSPSDQPIDLATIAMFSLRKTPGAHEGIHWEGGVSSPKFTAACLSNKARFNKTLGLLQDISQALSAGNDKKLEYTTKREEIMVRN